MKRIIKIWLIATIALGVGVNLFFFVYVQIARHNARALFEQVKNNDRRYVYETYWKSLHPVFYVEDLEDTSLLITYYSKIVANDTPAYIYFKNITRFYTLHEPVYVYKYLNKGSRIIQLVDFDKSCWGYFKGYFYTPTAHVQAPPDSLVKKQEMLIEEDKYDKEKQLSRQIAKKISIYGWYCDD